MKILTKQEIAQRMSRAKIKIEASEHADLYRLRFGDGTLSDFSNLTRISDAALINANRILKIKDE